MARLNIGTAFFGPVDRIPGEACVATRFFHVCGLALVPLASYVLPRDSLLFSSGSSPGVHLPLSLKSVALAWLSSLVSGLQLGLVLLVCLTYVGAKWRPDVFSHGWSNLWQPATLIGGLLFLVSMHVLKGWLGRASVAGSARSAHLRYLLEGHCRGLALGFSARPVP